MCIAPINFVAYMLLAVIAGGALGMFVMAALTVGREENREADEDE